jgi:hypothetical protein
VTPERRFYELTDEQEAHLASALEHPPIMIPGDLTESVKASGRAAWQRIADDMGFDWTTVVPIDPADRRRFTAVPRI